MFGFVTRKMSDVLLSGAKTHLSVSEGSASMEEMRLAAIMALAMMMRALNRWPNDDESLDSVLREIQENIKPEGAEILAQSFAAMGDQAKKSGNKSIMYGFCIVANWLNNSAKIRRSGKLAAIQSMQAHREFLVTLLRDQEHLLSDDYLTELQLKVGF